MAEKASILAKAAARAGLAVACVASLGALIHPAAPAQAGGTATYKGSGVYNTTHVMMPLSNGDAVVQITTDTIATIEPSDSGYMQGDCAGLGLMAADGGLKADVYCTFTVVGGDSLDVFVSRHDEQGKLEVIGGTGAWEGATGTGLVRGRYEEGSSGTYDFEFEVTTP